MNDASDTPIFTGVFDNEKPLLTSNGVRNTKSHFSISTVENKIQIFGYDEYVYTTNESDSWLFSKIAVELDVGITSALNWLKLEFPDQLSELSECNSSCLSLPSIVKSKNDLEYECSFYVSTINDQLTKLYMVREMCEHKQKEVPIVTNCLICF